MISSQNPITGIVMPSEIDRRGLVPQCYRMRDGRTLRYFPDLHTELVRIDIIFNAGTSLQTKTFQSSAAIRLMTEGTSRHSALQIAEFMDFRGIIVERGNDTVTASLTVYCLVRHLDALLPMLREIVDEATYPQREFDLYIASRRQDLMAEMQKTSTVARLNFNQLLFGVDHPQGRYGNPDDLDVLTVDDVRAFHRDHLRLSEARLVVSGQVTPDVLEMIDRSLSVSAFVEPRPVVLPPPTGFANGRRSFEVPNAVQNTLRVGRLLPFRWDDMDYARFMVLSTLLGGFFGSRLMSNLREDKGYTYGVRSVTQVYRDSISFYVVTDVAADKAEPAMREIVNEIERLRVEPVADEELRLVRSCMLGDFMRSIDGIFERAERYCQMISPGIDERFTDNFMAVLEEGAVSPSDLQEMARRTLDPASLLLVSAGKV